MQTHLVYASAKLDSAFRARLAARVTATASRSRPAQVAPAEDSALPGELPRGAYLPGTVRSPRQTTEAAVYGPTRSRAPTTGIRRMADVSCCPERHGKDDVAAEGDGRRGRRRLIVTEEL